MSLWTKNEILESLQDQIISHDISDNIEIDEVIIDSRKKTSNSLFIAIKGENNDGHKYIEKAKENGAILSIISDKNYINKNSILVKDTFKALYKLAHFSRKRSQAKIIGITGSVGKTSVKEMLKLAFETQTKLPNRVFATIGNLNNHFGVPLSLCNFHKLNEFGIFEMGMNHAQEITPLSKLVRPHLAIITNVGPVHIEFFKNEEEIALAKSEIFSGLEKGGIALINKDNNHYNFISKQISKNSNSLNEVTFGQNENSDYQIINVEYLNSDESQITAKLKNQTKITYKISSTHDAVIFNSIIAVSCLDLLGNNLQKGLQELQKLSAKKGRGEIFDVNFNNKKITIIDDSYNASFQSIVAGINFAKKQKKNLNKKRLVIALGDMLELGKKSEEIHLKLANYLENIDFSILVGEKMPLIANNLPKNKFKIFSTSSKAKNEIEEILHDGDLLYIKGSRSMEMEEIFRNLK